MTEDAAARSRPGDAAPRSKRRLIAIVAVAVIGLSIFYAASIRSPASTGKPIDFEPSLPEPADAVGPASLRLVSFNIHSGKPPGGSVDLAGTAAVLKPVCVGGDAGVVVSLNEVRNPLFGPHQAAELTTAIGDRFSSAFLPTERRWFRNHFGNALLADTPAGAVLVRRLPSTGTKGFRVWATTGARLGDQVVSLFTTHVDSRGDRDRQLEIVTAIFLNAVPPAAVVGDFNAPPDHPLLTAMRESSPDVFDALADADGLDAYPDHIDHIIVRGLQVTDAAIVANDASDHPLVWADVRLPTFDAGDTDEAGDADGRPAGADAAVSPAGDGP
ncbi:MAG: endonuclease/exonuclease/phosphatase family protein [Planctomycetota bacterium]